MKFDFILSRDKQAIGHISWYCGGDEGNGSLSGDAKAVATLQTAMQKGIEEEWRGRFPRHCVIVENPLNYISEMVTVIQKGGFDMPSVFQEFIQLQKGAAHHIHGTRY